MMLNFNYLAYDMHLYCIFQSDQRFIPCKNINPFVDGTCDYCFDTDILLYPVLSMNVCWVF